MELISNHIYKKLWDVFTQPYHNITAGVIKTPLKLVMD